MKIYRHGDVLLRQINVLPEGLKKTNATTVALGEVTGHSHRFNSGLVTVFEDIKKQKYVAVEEETTLIHEEHKPIQVMKGLFQVVMEKEYDVLAEAERQVLD